METELVAYIERLELMAFFTGYPLVYSIVKVISGNLLKKDALFAGKMVKLLPYAYALAATLFIGLVVRDALTSYKAGVHEQLFSASFFTIWGCLAILCWLPGVANKPVLSLYHSLVFFFLLLKDIFSDKVSAPDIIRNDMKVYTDSLLLHVACYLLIFIIFLILNRVFKKPMSSAK